MTAIKTYNPQISVKLIKSIKRTEVFKDMKVVAERYGELLAIDLTPYLGDMGGVHVSKGVRDPSGAFSVTLSDQKHTATMESIYALVEPMDIIEIRAAHNAADANPANGMRLPILMRGLVSNVGRQESMVGGKPARSITIAGQDFGKVLQIILIRLLNGTSVMGDNILHEFGFFTKYMNGTEKQIKSAEEFLKDVVSGIINPFLKRLVQLADGRPVGVKVLNEWTLDCSIVEGTVSPYAIQTTVNTSLYAMLVDLLDVGPFNELYVEDREDEIALVARPSPLYTPDRKIVQSNDKLKVTTVEINSVDVVANSPIRSDQGVANYYWAYYQAMPFLTNEDAKALSQHQGGEGDYLQYDYMNSRADRYGIRFMEVNVKLGPDNFSYSDATKKTDLPEQTTDMMSWLAKKSATLARLNRDNVVFETGSLRLRGNEKIKAGCFLDVKRGTVKMPTRYYAVRVDHDFAPLQGFYTSVSYERGTGFIDRAQEAVPTWISEIEARGIS